MIERGTIINATADLEHSIGNGEDFDEALASISLDYGIPANAIIANIERVKSLEDFKVHGNQAVARRKEREQMLEPLRQHLNKLYGAASEPMAGFFGTSVFIQKNFELEIRPQAHAFARRYIKTMRLTKNRHGNQNA